MHKAQLKDMISGWFIGSFTPTALNTDACEVAVKHYLAGDSEPAHYHKIATEVTLILSGKVKMVGCEWNTGDIIVLPPNEISAFEALTDVITVVVKIPGALDDKYLPDHKYDIVHP